MVITTAPITEADEYEKRKVRHFTFRTSEGKEGVVTGLPLTVDCKVVRMYSAGCLHGNYVMNDGDVILKSEPLFL